MQFWCVGLLLSLAVLTAAEIQPFWPPTQPVLVANGLGSRSGSVLPCDKDYWRIETFTDVQVDNYLVIDFNQTGEPRLPSERGTLYVKHSLFSDLKTELEDDTTIIDTLGELPGPNNFDLSCSDERCILEINCDFTNGTYYMAVAGGDNAIVQYNFTVYRRTLNVTALTDRRPIAFFNDSQRRVLNELNYEDPPAPTFPDRAHKYRFYSIDIPESRFSEGTYLIVNISRAEPFPFGDMRLHYGNLPLSALDNGVTGEDDSDCIYEYCVDTRVTSPNHNEPYYDRPVRNHPRIPCECTPDIQRFEGGSFQLTCNLTVDPCNFKYGRWYISLELRESDNLFNTTVDTLYQSNYTLAAIVVQPTVTSLFRNVTFKGFAEPERATHYKMVVPEENFAQGDSHMLVHISNIRGGSLNINVHRGLGVGANLAGGREGCAPANATCTSSDACNLVIEKCHFQPGTWYISLEVAFIAGSGNTGFFLVDDFDRLPITFTIRANWMDDSTPVRLLAGVPHHSFIGEALYDFYVVNVPATIDTWLYVELFTQAKDTEVILSMLHGELPGGECYARPDFYCLTGDSRALEYNTGNPQNEIVRPLARESCSFMIQTCELEAGPLYLSVYGHHINYNPYGDNTYYQVPVQYTLWVDFDVALAVESAVSYSEHVFQNQYQHYYIRADNVNEGSSMSVEVTNIQHGVPQTVEVFVNYNFLAGNCPCYDHLYNCTGSNQPSCGGVIPDEEPNFLPDPDTVRLCCTIVVPPCDFRSGVWYLAVLGVNEDRVQYTTPIGYTLTATIIPAPVVEPLILGQVEADEVTQWNVTNEYKHYKLAAQPLPLHDLVVKLVYTQNCEYKPKHDNLRDTLTVYLNSKSLASSECHKYTCEANIESHSYCTIVVPHCEWDAEDWFVSVQGNFDAVFPGRYSLSANVEEVRDSALTSGVTVYGRAAYQRFSHYYLDIQGDETRTLYVDLYTNADQDSITAYLNVDTRADPTCYGAAPYACLGETSCSWQIEGCQLNYGRYYIAVAGANHQFYDISVEFALTATLKANTVRLGEGDPITGHVLVDQYRHYQFDVASVDAGQFLLFEVENVKHGVVIAYMNFGALAGRCAQCQNYEHTDSCVADSDNLEDGDPNWCELRVPPCLMQSGTFYFSIAGVEEKTPDVPLLLATEIGYTLEVNLVDAAIVSPTVVPTRVVSNQLTSQFIANGRYRHYSFEINEDQWSSGHQVIVEISRIREGALFVYYGKTNPADEYSECNDGRICSTSDMGVGGSCFWQMPYCLTDIGNHYISVEGITGRLQASYSILIWLQPPLSLDANPSYAGLTSERSNNILASNELNVTHVAGNQPNGWTQFIRLDDVSITEEGDALELFFYRISNNPGASTAFEVYLYPEEPAGAGDCCDSAPGSCQSLPCLRRVRQTTQSLLEGGETTRNANQFLCGVGANSTEPGFEGLRCNVTVWGCDLASSVGNLPWSGSWWATIIPVASSDVATETVQEGLEYSLQWRVRNVRRDANGVIGASTNLNSAINSGDYTQFYQMDVYEDFRSFSFNVDVPTDVHKRVIVQTDYEDGTTADDVIVYVNKNSHAGPYCNDGYACTGDVIDQCDCSGRYVSASCCTSTGTYYISVRNRRDVRENPVGFRFRISVITESDVVPITGTPVASSAFTFDTEVLPENYDHYHVSIDDDDFELHSSLVVVLQKTGSDENSLGLFARAGRQAGDWAHALNTDLFPVSENCASYQYSCTASGSPDDSDPFDVDGRCVLQIPYCQLPVNDFYISVYHPDFFEPGTCDLASDARPYTISVYFDNEPRQLTLGQAITVAETAPLGLRYNNDDLPTFVHYSFDVSAADLAYDVRDALNGYYTRFLRVELGDFTVGTADLFVNYDDNAGSTWFCLNSFASASNCDVENCIVDVLPCDGTDDDDNVDDGDAFYDNGFKLVTGRYYVAVRIPVLAAYSLEASILTHTYTDISDTAFLESGTGHRDTTENVVYTVEPDALARFNQTEFRYVLDTRSLNNDDDDDISGRDYFIANMTVISEDLSPSVTLNVWRDDCTRWTCTVNSVNGSCVIDAVALSTCSSKGGRYYFRVDSPIYEQDTAVGFRLNFYHNESTVQGIRNEQTLTEIIYPHEYEEYFYNPTDVGLGSTLRVTITASCGDLEAFIKPNGRAGPSPDVSTSEGPCSIDYCRTGGGADQRELDESTAVCELFLDTCYFEQVGYWIGIRGVQTEFPSADNENLYLPIKYHIKVEQVDVEFSQMWPSVTSVVNYAVSPSVAPQQFYFDYETHNLGAVVKFSMRIPHTLVGTLTSDTALHISRNRAIGYTAGCPSMKSCVVPAGSSSCSIVVDAVEGDALFATKYFAWADAPRGTEVLVERWDPVIPSISRNRVYTSVLNGPDSDVLWQLPYNTPRQYYRFDIEPDHRDFFVRARLYDVQHGELSMTINSAGRTASGSYWFAPVPEDAGTLVWNDECAFVDSANPCVADIHRCDIVGATGDSPYPTTLFITIHGLEQTCELHAIQYSLKVEERQETERLAINDGGECASVEENEYNYYRVSPHEIESPQQTILSIKVSDVDISSPEEVLVIVNDGSLATEDCFTTSSRSDVFVGQTTIDYPCGYSDLFVSVQGLRSADQVSPINYHIEVVKQLVDVHELEDDLGYIVADESFDFGDDEDSCNHARDFYRFAAVASDDRAAYLEVTVESEGEVTVYVNKESFAWEGCAPLSCSSDSSSEPSGCKVHDYCTFQSGDYYITVVAEQEYTILAKVVEDVTALSLTDKTRGRVDLRDTVFYSLTLRESDFNADSRLVIEVTDVYYGDVEASIRLNKLPSGGDDDDEDCHLDHTVVETYFPIFSFDDELTYSRLVVDHTHLSAGTYYIAVDGKDSGQDCKSIRFSLVANIESLGVGVSELSIGSPAQPSPQYVARYSADIAGAVDPVYSYYVVSGTEPGSAAFGQIRLMNVEGGSLRLRVKTGHLATSDHAFFPGSRNGLVSSGRATTIDTLYGRSIAEAGFRPNTWQEIIESSDDQDLVIPGSWDWWCDAEYVDGVSEENQKNKGCNIVINSCDWTTTEYYIAVEARAQDYQDSPISFDLQVDQYKDYRLLSPDQRYTERFNNDNPEAHFWAAQQTEQESVRIRTVVTEGEQVTITVRDDRCADNARWERSLTCANSNADDAYLCDLELPTRAAHPGPNSRTFFVTVEGKNATYSIAYWRQRQNCHEFKGDGRQDGLDFCAGLVPYTVWRWNDYATLDNEARGKFLELYDHFRVQPCWSGVTPECNSTLQRYACYESFPRCDRDGFYVGTCRKACEAVAYECVNTFETVNLEHLDCKSDRYLDETTEPCTGHREEEPLSNNVFLNDVNVILFESNTSSAAITSVSLLSVLVLALLAALF